jgi:hypothetical protein
MCSPLFPQHPLVSVPVRWSMLPLVRQMVSIKHWCLPGQDAFKKKSSNYLLEDARADAGKRWLIRINWSSYFGLQTGRGDGQSPMVGGGRYQLSTERYWPPRSALPQAATGVRRVLRVDFGQPAAHATHHAGPLRHDWVSVCGAAVGARIRFASPLNRSTASSPAETRNRRSPARMVSPESGSASHGSGYQLVEKWAVVKPLRAMPRRSGTVSCGRGDRVRMLTVPNSSRSRQDTTEPAARN